jgi:5,10-methylenetetrahydrofolate reductase
MAKALTETTGQIELPERLLDDLDHDRDAGIDRACSLMEDIKNSGAFDGVHLIPVGRYRAVAARLEQEGWLRNRRVG